MPIYCSQGFTGYDACRGCRWLNEFYCWPPPRNAGEKGTSIYEILTLNERVCLLEDDVQDVLGLLMDEPLPPNYKELSDRVEQLAGKTEHLHQEQHYTKKESSKPF